MMKLYPSLEVAPKREPVVVALGFFDGLHIGHQRVIEEAKNIAREVSAKVCVITFYPHPRTVLMPSEHIYLLGNREEKIEFKKEEINQYKEYYKQIEEKDLTRGDELLQYLAFEKYEDLTDLLIQGLYSFCEGEYSKGRRTFKSKYEELFSDEVEEFGKLQNSYLELYQYFFVPDSNFFISSTALLKIIELLEISNIGTTKALREQLEMVNKKLFGFDVRFFKSETKDVKISIVENLKSYGKETGKFEIKDNRFYWKK